MPRKNKPFKIKCQEEGRGPIHTESFATLPEAQKYIKDRWQGADYVDNRCSFHTDYCTYSLVGFTLQDIGNLRPVWYEDPDTGKQVLDFMIFDFRDLSEAA